MPYENEFSCDLLDSKEFVRFARQERTSKEQKKKYSVVIGWREDESSEDQSFRYNKNVWTEQEAKLHCKAHKGKFEGLKELKGGDNLKQEKKLQEYIFCSPGEVELQEGHLVSIELLKEGEYKHEKAPGGILRLTKEKLMEFLANFNDKICGKELPIDLAHVIDDKGSVGWLRRMWIKAEGGLSHLWGELDIVSQDVQRRVKSGELKYFSPTLNFGFEDPESGNTFDVIRAGALTNYPYLKNMSPAVVNFSEIKAGKTSPDRENGHKLHLVEGQRDLLKKLYLSEVKENRELKQEKQTLALELKMSELGSAGRITPAEKYQVRELMKESTNAGLIALKVYEARVNPVIEFGQKSEVVNERRTGYSVKELIELTESKDKEVREKAMQELSERYDKKQQKKGGL